MVCIWQASDWYRWQEATLYTLYDIRLNHKLCTSRFSPVCYYCKPEIRSWFSKHQAWQMIANIACASLDMTAKAKHLLTQWYKTTNTNKPGLVIWSTTHQYFVLRLFRHSALHQHLLCVFSHYPSHSKSI